MLLFRVFCLYRPGFRSRLTLFLLMIMPVLIYAQDTIRHDHTSRHPHRQYTLGVSDNSVSNCPNSNFSMGDFTNWVGHYGTFNNPSLNTGFVSIPPNERHLIIPAPGYVDNYGTTLTGPEQLITVFPGEAFSARLGNSATGAQAEQLTYDITVGPQTDFFIYRYAVVLNDNGHQPNEQPRFTIDIIDKATGKEFDSVCGFYDVYAQPGLPGWLTSPLGGGSGGAPVYWKDWTTVGLAFDVSDYGKQLSIVFTTKDCLPSGHFGYAYISAFCTSLTVTFAGCEGSNQVTMTGPPGFADYEWTGPFCAGCTPAVVGNNQVLVVNNANTGDEYRLKLVSFYNYPNCVIQKVSSTVAFTNIIANFTPAINCIGNPSSFTDISSVNQNATDQRIWNFGDGTPTVTVNTAVTTHSFAAAGTYNVTMIRGTTDPCYDTAIISVTVSEVPPVITNLPDTVHICSKGKVGVNLNFSQATATGSWNSAVKTGAATIVHLPASQTGSFINDSIINTGGGTAVVRYLVTPNTGNCYGIPDTMTVMVHPFPIPAITGPVEVCEGSANNIYNTATGKTGYTWNVSGGIITAGSGTSQVTVTWNTPGTRSISVGYTDEFGCTSASPSTKNITVNANPVPTFVTSSVNVCEGATGVNYSTQPGKTGYQWNISTGGTITSGATSNAVQVTWSTPGSGTTRWIEVNYTDGNGCTAATPSRIYVTVNALPNVIATPTALTICSGTMAQVNLSSSIPGTSGAVFNWSISAPPSVTPNTLTGTGNISQVFSNSSNTPQNVLFSITGNMNGCISGATPFTLTVNPVPNTSVSQASQMICSGASSSNINITSAVTGTQFNWSVTCDPGIRIPCPAAGSASSPAILGNATIFNDGTSPQNVIYSITSSFGGCAGTGATHTVTVNPVPNVVTGTSEQTICSGSSSAAVSLSTNITGATVNYLWTVACDPGIVSCPPSGGPANQIPSSSIAVSGTVFTQQNVTYTITPVVNSCPGTTGTFTTHVNPIPDLTITPANHPVICSGSATNFTLHSQVASPTFLWNANGDTHITPANLINQTDNPIQRVFSNNGTTPENVSFTLYSQASGCTSLPVSYTVTVNPVANVVLNSPSQTICSGTQSASVPLTTNITGAPVNYSWTVSCDPGILTCPAAGASATQIPFSVISLNTTTFIQQNATFTITPAIGTCPGVTSAYLIHINPIPDLSISPLVHPAICSGSATNFTLLSQVASPSYLWSATAAPDILPSTLTNQVDNPVQRTFTNSGNIVEQVNFSITVSASGCTSNSYSYNIPVNPVPNTVLGSTSQTICSGSTTSSVNINSSVSGTIFNWTVACDPGIRTPCPVPGNCTTPCSTGNTTLYNDAHSPQNVTYNITSSFGGCPGTGATHTITVNPVADVVMTTSNQTKCSGTPTDLIPLSSSVTGATVFYNWSLTCDPGIVNCPAPGGSSGQIPSVVINLNNTVFTTQDAVYTIIPSANGCPGTPSTYITHVNPIPNLIITPATHPVICSGSATNFLLSSSVTTPSYSWSASGDTHVTPSIITGQTETPVQRTFANSGNSPENVTFTISATAAGCTSSPTQYTVPVNPVADVTLNQVSQTKCSGTPTDAIPLSTNITGTTVSYTWTVACEPGILSCPPAGGPANLIPSSVINLDNTTFIQKNGVFTIVPAIGSCNGTPSLHTVHINPIPDLSLTPAIHPAVCSGGTTNFTFLSQVNSTTFLWNVSAGANISPVVPPNQTDNPVTQTFTNSGLNIEPVTFTATASAAGCTSLPVTYTVNFSPKPSVVFPVAPSNPQQVCSGATFVSVPLQSDVTLPGVTYHWTASAFDPVNPTLMITGFTTPGSGNTIPGENISSSLLTQGVIKYSVTPTFTTAGVGCSGDPSVYQVQVNPSPTVALTPTDPTGQTICSGNTSASITFVPNASPSVYTWLAVENTGVTGAVLNGNTDFIPAQTLTTTGPVQGHVRYQVTPIYQGSGTFTCPGGVSYSTIYVNPLPQPVISGRTLVCELQPDERYSTPSVPGNSYNWNVTGASSVLNPNSNEVTITWGAYGNSPGTLSVTEIINATGCQKTTPVTQVILQQRPIPDITGPVNFLCEQSGGFKYETEKNMTNYTWLLTGGTITSGGGAGNDFAIVTWNTPGLQSISVNYLNSLNCPGFPAKVLPVTIYPLPNTTITGGSGPDCENASHTYLSAGEPQCTYNWSVTPSSSGIITAGQGTSTVTINWNNAGNALIGMTATNTSTTCNASTNYPVEIHPKPIPVFNPCFDLITTSGAKKFSLRGATPNVAGQGIYSGNRVSFNSMTGQYEFDPFGAGTGIYSVFYSFTNTYGCSATSSPVNITVQNNSFTCGEDFTDPRDGKKYRTGMLAGKCWFRDNLSFGTVITNQFQPQSDNCIPEKYCSQDDIQCLKFGGFYQWDELMQFNNDNSAKGICPPGWHVPSEYEWQEMIDNLIFGINAPLANGVAGGTLKDPLITGGFNALLSGIYYNNAQWSLYSGSNTATMFWTSTQAGTHQAVARGLNIFTPSVSKYSGSKGNSYPVRCRRD